ncbi:MAG: Hsp20/alpha crystallin family protein [Hyphomicrobiales bacterium]
MPIRDLIPWNRRSSELGSEGVEHPVLAMQRDINRMFDGFFDRFAPLAANNGAFPRADVAETDNEVEVSIELPGIAEKDIDVSVANDVLTIRGEKKNGREEKRQGYYLAERSYGAFHRAIALPPGVDGDKAKAEFKQGILTVTLPKTPEARSKVKKIDVKAA